LVAPAVLYLVVLFVVPIGYMLPPSVTDPTASLANYWRSVGMSFWTGFIVRTYAWLVILGSRGPSWTRARVSMRSAIAATPRTIRSSAIPAACWKTWRC
jgi:hypothetical protein